MAATPPPPAHVAIIMDGNGRSNTCARGRLDTRLGGWRWIVSSPLVRSAG